MTGRQNEDTKCEAVREIDDAVCGRGQFDECHNPLRDRSHPFVGSEPSATVATFDAVGELDEAYSLVADAVKKLSRIARLKDAGRINLGRVENWRNHLYAFAKEMQDEVCDAE